MAAKKKPTPKKPVATTKSGSNSRDGFAKATSVISRRNQNGTVILMRLDKSSSFYKIDGIAAEVWSCFEAPASVAKTVEFFAKRYPAKAKSLQREIDELAKKLMKFGLLAEFKGPFAAIPPSVGGPKKPSEFGQVQEFDLEQIETEVLNESVYLDVFAGSDLAIKTDMTPIEGALEKVLQLDGVTHLWKGRNRTRGVQAGLIAQQVAEQMPELVRRDPETNVLAVNYQKLSSYLVEAIKDLNRLRVAQDRRLKKLESRL